MNDYRRGEGASQVIVKKKSKRVSRKISDEKKIFIHLLGFPFLSHIKAKTSEYLILDAKEKKIKKTRFSTWGQ
jgi:hypothetical protein